MVFNKIKIAVVALCGFAVTAVLAFDNPEPVASGNLDIEWFQYLGDMHGDAEENPDNYQKVDAPVGCDGGQFLCAIQAEEDTANPGHPTQEGVDDPLDTEERSTPITP